MCRLMFQLRAGIRRLCVQQMTRTPGETRVSWVGTVLTRMRSEHARWAAGSVCEWVPICRLGWVTAPFRDSTNRRPTHDTGPASRCAPMLDTALARVPSVKTLPTSFPLQFCLQFCGHREVLAGPSSIGPVPSCLISSGRWQNLIRTWHVGCWARPLGQDPSASRKSERGMLLPVASTDDFQCQRGSAKPQCLAPCRYSSRNSPPHRGSKLSLNIHFVEGLYHLVAISFRGSLEVFMATLVPGATTMLASSCQPRTCQQLPEPAIVHLELNSTASHVNHPANPGTNACRHGWGGASFDRNSRQQDSGPTGAQCGAPIRRSAQRQASSSVPRQAGHAALSRTR